MAEASPKKVPLWKRALRGIVVMTGTASVIALAAAAVWMGSTTLASRADAVATPPPTEIATVAALRIVPSDGMNITRAFYGQVEAAQTVAMSFEQGGRLNTVLVDEGDRVIQGQLLAALDTRLLNAERARLTASRDALAAQVELSRRTTERQKELRQRGFASDQAVDNVALALTALEAQMAEIDAALLRVDVQLSQTELRAPFDGVVGARLVDPGAIMAVGTPVLDLREESAALFRVGVDPKIASQIAAGPARIEIDGVQYDARFAGFRPDLDAQTRTRTALFKIDTDDPIYLAAGRLIVQTQFKAQGYAIPLSALRDGVRGLWTVLALEPGGADNHIVRPAAVEVLQVEGDRAYVRGTLSGAALIIPDGTHRLVPGDLVRVAGAE